MFGKTLQQMKIFYSVFNDTNIYNNCHIAVAGSSGTGKKHNLLRVC